MPERAVQTVCPHCGRSLAQVEQVSEDHVVGAAFGGVETVPACKRCNDAVGGGVEARLLSPTGWFTILSQGAGYTDGSDFGKTESGKRVRMDFGGHGWRRATRA